MKTTNQKAAVRSVPGIALALCLSCGTLVFSDWRDREPDLKTVLRRVASYAADYHERFTALVAEEHYTQRSLPEDVRSLRAAPRPQERTLKSDYVILRDFAGPNSWVGVRDVFEINGEPVNTDRTRLQALLNDTTRPLVSRLRALADLQAKFNVGDLYRTINVPTLPLEFLLPDRQPRFKFKHKGETTMHDTPVWIVTFDERDHPTIIRTPDGGNVPSHGSFWIDPERGGVLRSELRTADLPGSPLRSIILVSYAYNERFDMLLPDDMNELYLTGRARIEGHATYSNYRRWEAEVKIRIPNP